MERLSFSIYRALNDQLETYETHLLQLQRDYACELRGETLWFAVDFSELHDYIHWVDKDAYRAAINSYILNTLHDRFTILPGAVGELLTDLERVVPKALKPSFGQALYSYPSVVEFRARFSDATCNEEHLIKLYADAEAELRSALGAILDVAVRGHKHTSLEALQSLLGEGKLTPIDGVRQVGPLSADLKRLFKLVESHLEVSRPGQTESNRVDAIDVVVALRLNQQESATGKRSVHIYSQALSLIRACRSHEDLRWDNDYVIRELKYFQYRARLQELFPTTQQRFDHIVEWSRLCQKLQSDISSLVNVDKQLRERPIEPSLRLIDSYRRFEEECMKPLLVKQNTSERRTSREHVEQLYRLLRDEATFEGEIQDAHEVLKEHFREMHRQLGCFAPTLDDTGDARMYKARLLAWLDLGDLETPEAPSTELAGGRNDDTGVQS